MARLALGQPIRSAEPTIPVDAGLPAGGHRFQLEVIDSAGRRSPPDVAVVTIQRLTIPIPPIVRPIVPPLRTPIGLRTGPLSPVKKKRSKSK